VIKAARLQWNLEQHPELAKLLRRGLAGTPKLCPFVVNMRPKAWRLTGKRHSWQVLPDRLSKEFAKARVAAKVGGEHPPTFHEIRSLGSALLAAQGEQLTDVMELMGHSEESITLLYQSGHALPHQDVGIRINDVGGKW
jgi:enterobacteria phage integrase